MSATTSNAVSPPNALFVYGTLMTGESRHPMLQAGQIKSVVRASISGKLLNLGEYPGMYLASDIKARVQGELIEFEALDAILSDIDEEEGAEFKREMVNVTLETGDGHFAWTYALVENDETKPVIESGDWRARG